MKGLLLKDIYLLKNVGRTFLLLAVVFILAALGNAENQFFLYYPCILAGMVVVSLMAYDEREKWDTYAATLPYSRAQFVSVKYVLSLIIGLTLVLLNTLAQALRMNASGTFEATHCLGLLTTMLPLSLLPTALLLPFIFRFGVEKGRILYYVVLGIFLGLTLLIDNDTVSVSTATICMISLLLYAASWQLSIRLYRKKEIH